MTAPTHLLSVLTPDRRGIIAGITGLIDDGGGSLLELSQTVVRNYFTITLVVALPDDETAAAISERVRARVGADASVILLPYHEGTGVAAVGEAYVLTAVGRDGVGVIHTLSDLIAQRGGNFSDFSSRVSEGRISVIAEVELPADAELDQLQIDLEHTMQAIGVEVRFQHHRLFLATNEIAFRRVSDAAD